MVVGVVWGTQKGPKRARKTKIISFFFIALLKMLGFIKKLKWNFPFSATSFSTGYLQIDLEQIVGKGFMAFFHSMLNKYHTQKVLPRSNDRKFAN